MARGIAYRRHQRERAVKHAVHVLHVVWPGSINPDRRVEPPAAYKYADNMRRCSCEFCQPGSSGRQVKRADEKLAWELSRL